MLRSHTAVGLLCFALSFPAGAMAQATAAGKVTGTGVATLNRQPELLRLQVQLMAKGKTPQEALARLKDRREAAALQLAALGANKQSIRFEETAINSALNDRQRQMEAMIRSRMRGRGKPGDAAPKRPALVTVNLTAEWPLKSTNPEELLLLAHELEEKVKEADLAGAKEAEQLSPQEEELVEEMAQLTADYGSGQQEPGTPVFVYVCKVSEEDRAKLTAQAFEQARTRATRLAAAAGKELGALRELGDGIDNQPDMSNLGGYSGMAYQMLMQQAGVAQEKGADEAVGQQPGKITYRVTVTAAFDLK